MTPVVPGPSVSSPSVPNPAASNSAAPTRVALLSTGGRAWVAGIIYVHNLVRALDLLPPGERPEVRLLLGPRSSAAGHRELGGQLPRWSHYARFPTWPWWKKAAGVALALRHGRAPSSLERVAGEIGAEVVFPALESLDARFPVPWIGWIPDFQHLRMPEFFSPSERRERDDRFLRLAEEAPRLVVSSGDARADLEAWLPEATRKTSVLSFPSVASDGWFEGDPPATARRLGLPAKFLVYPSQFWVHKNHGVLFDAVARVRAMGHDDIALVCTGHRRDPRHPEHSERLLSVRRELDLARHVRILGLLPRDQHVQVLRAAAAVVQPSLFEGWSAIVEDARALGKRMYASDIPVHREQDPPRVTFFPPARAEALAEAVARDWPHLSPGPDLEREAEARREGRRRALAFARAFLAIAAGTSRSW